MKPFALGQFVALGQIVGLKEGRLVATGNTKADGSPGFRRESDVIEPGETFECDLDMAKWLIAKKVAAPVGSEAAQFAASRHVESEYYDER